nr:Acyl-[acyl-carrier-protein]--UDP-N-acetylglucosamine O-acyltransferase [Cupriavidus sp.]
MSSSIHSVNTDASSLPLRHPTSVVSPSAKVHSSVRIGPYSVIGEDVEIDEGCVIGAHVVLTGPMRMGKRCKVYPFASLGEAPQDIGYRGESTSLEIGDDNIIRESVTINRGTLKGGGVTRVGSRNFIMAYCHIGHDCIVGSDNILANNAALAGHVEIGDQVSLGGFTLVHQFCRVGSYAFTGMGTALNQDLAPFVLATGNYARAIGLNKIGLRRKGFSADCLEALDRVYRTFLRRRDPNAIALLQQDKDCYPEVRLMIDFIATSRRGVIRYRP